jgi:Hemopexin/Transglycosylase SLT domain
MSSIDAAVMWDNGKAYFFRGSDYVRFDVASDQVDQEPRPIADGWPGVFADGVDAAVLWNNGKAYFFRGSDYARYDVASDQVDQEARPIADGWPGMMGAGPGPGPSTAATADLSGGFFASVRSTSAELGCNPIDLLAVMMSESSVKASAHNPKGHASGLIQFMPATLERLGWTRRPRGVQATRC